jgi:hypothetical protein
LHDENEDLKQDESMTDTTNFVFCFTFGLKGTKRLYFKVKGNQHLALFSPQKTRGAKRFVD